MAAANQQRLKNLWDQAFRDYYNTQQQIHDEKVEKTRKHKFPWGHEKIVVPKPPPPKQMSADDFRNEVSKSQAAFTDMRMKHHKIFDVLESMATPIQVIGGQASAVGGMFSPAALMVFSAVMYLFNTGKQVAADLDAMAQLFYRCNRHITQISVLVRARLLSALEDVIIGSLIAVLDVCTISVYDTQRGRFEPFVEELFSSGGGEAQAALERLKDLAEQRDSTILGATYVGVDALNQKSDKMQIGQDELKQKTDIVLGGVSGISDEFSKMGDKIIQKLSSISKEKSEDKAPSTVKDSNATVQQKKQKIAMH